MFESLKSKMKSLFSRSKNLDESKIYKEETTEQVPPTIEQVPEPAVVQPVEQKQEVPVKEEAPAVEPVVDVPVVKDEPKAEPKKSFFSFGKSESTKTPEEPKLSRKEMLKLKKQEKLEAKHSVDSNDIVGDSGKKIKEDPLDEILDELEIILLEADVAYSVVEEIKTGVKENLMGKKYDRSYSLEQVVEMALKDAIRNVLKINEFDFDQWLSEKDRPTVIMFVGINGTGKTTAIAKIANRIQSDGKTVVMAACDTFRAGAIEQLNIHADKLGCKIVKQAHDADPAAVAYDAIEHAKSKRKDVVLIDTAGRMQTNNNLIEEMKKIVRVSKPDLKVFVGDSLAGNDAIEQAKVFDAAVGIDAVILTKIDTDAKGGAALSIAHTIGKPIAFVCNGQEYGDIIKFNTEWMIDRMFSDE
ncbi:MAG: signal recognition particle-docking protein FtsY [Candidatus Methanomethylophilaceae archaeon]|nr:signal recognition particle-docking protein FtsY [Candidatus Methanomethylophilaceae archaeon]